MPTYEVVLKRTLSQQRTVFVEADEPEDVEAALDDLYEIVRDEAYDAGWERAPGEEEGEPGEHELLGGAPDIEPTLRLDEDGAVAIISPLLEEVDPDIVEQVRKAMGEAQ